MEAPFDITMATKILGIGHPDEKTDADKKDARAVLKYFGVESYDAPKEPGTFGKPGKLYNAAQVRKIAGFKL